MIYTSILKIQQSLKIRVQGLLLQTYETLPESCFMPEYIKSTSSPV